METNNHVAAQQEDAPTQSVLEPTSLKPLVLESETEPEHALGRDPVTLQTQGNVTDSVPYDGTVSLPGPSPTLEESDMSEEADAIDEIKQALRDKLEVAINNPRFWAKDIRYETLMNAMNVPLFDDRSLHQFSIHAESYLKSEAATKSFNTGVPAVLPTEEDIIVETWRRWVAEETKEVTKSLNKLRREEAKRTGVKFTPVPIEEVQAIVAKAEADLRASENSYVGSN